MKQVTLILSYLIILSLLGCSSSEVTSSPSVTIVSPVSNASPASPVPTITVNNSTVVATVKNFDPIEITGNGTMKSAPFNVNSMEFVLKWDFVPKFQDDPNSARLIFNIYKVGNSNAVQFCDSEGIGGTSFCYSGAGDYYLDIISTNILNWCITISPIDNIKDAVAKAPPSIIPVSSPTPVKSPTPTIKSPTPSPKQMTLNTYLEENFSTLETSIGTTSFKFVIDENDSIIFPYDYWIQVEYDLGFFIDVRSSNKITKSQANQVCKELKEFQEKLAQSVIELFPDKKIEGGYYHSWYTYPNIQVDLNIRRYYSWVNYSPTGLFSDYDNSQITGFSWYPDLDDELTR